MIGLGTTGTFDDQDLYDPAASSGGYFDADGHQVAYANFSAVDDAGTLRFAGGPFSQVDHSPHWEWTNATDSYTVYNTANGVNAQQFGNQFNLTSSLGIIGLVAVIMAVATIVGLRVLGVGVAEESVSAIIKGSALVTVWLMFSAIAMGLITSISPGGFPIGPMFYFFLTLVYTLGIINQIGHPGED